MNGDGKYIIIIENDFLGPTPILFPKTIKHSDVAAFIGGKVISAGFWDLDIDMLNNKVSYRCFGESYSLKIGSRHELDDIVLNSCLPSIGD